MNNEFLSSRIVDLNGKRSDLQATIEHSDEINLEKFEAIDRNVSQINSTFRNHDKKHRPSFIKNRGKITLLRGQFSKK